MQKLAQEQYDLHMSPSVSRFLKGQVTKSTTLKWTIVKQLPAMNYPGREIIHS